MTGYSDSDAVIVGAVRTPVGKGKPSGALQTMCEAGGMANTTIVERLG